MVLCELNVSGVVQAILNWGVSKRRIKGGGVTNYMSPVRCIDRQKEFGGIIFQEVIKVPMGNDKP